MDKPAKPFVSLSFLLIKTKDMICDCVQQRAMSPSDATVCDCVRQCATACDTRSSLDAPVCDCVPLCATACDMMSPVDAPVCNSLRLCVTACDMMQFLRLPAILRYSKKKYSFKQAYLKCTFILGKHHHASCCGTFCVIVVLSGKESQHCFFNRQ